MKKVPYAEYKDKAKNWLANIPFFSDLSYQDPDAHQLLLKQAEIIEMKAGDVLLTKGQVDKHFYFLLKGGLSIYAEASPGPKSEPLGRLAHGQVVGALAAIAGIPRTATVMLHKNASEDALVFSVDMALLGELTDFSKISRSTKLALYRNVVNNTRFKLEGYKSKNPNHPITQEYLAIGKFSGEKDSVEELQHLAGQLAPLAQVMQKWNEV